jgi:hypothetical protein
MSDLHRTNLARRICFLFVSAVAFAPGSLADIVTFDSIAFDINVPLAPNMTIEIPSCFPVDRSFSEVFCSGTVTTDASGNIIAGDFSGGTVETFTAAGAEYIGLGSTGYDVFCGNPDWCCIPGTSFGATTCGACPIPNTCGVPAQVEGGGVIPDGTNIFGLGIWMNPAAPTPEPTTLTLLGLGTIGLAGLRNGKRRQVTQRTS